MVFFMKKHLFLPFFIAISLLMSGILAACGGSGKSSSAPAYSRPGSSQTYASDELAEGEVPMVMGDYAYEESAKAAAGGSGSGTGVPTDADGPQLDEKLVYTGNLSIQSLEYDSCAADIRKKIKEFNGIIQSESESDDDYHWYYDDHTNSSVRTLYLTVRIPSAKFYDFLSSVGESGKVISRSVNVENISQTYSDTKTQIEALEIEETRLLEMMEKADTIEDMIAVESRLTEVQTDLNFYKTNLRGMDTDVAWSTISLSLEEVKKYSPTVVEQTFGEKVQEAFSDAWSAFRGFVQGLILVLIRLLPFLLLILAIFLAVWFILKKTAPRREARRLKKEITKAEKLAEKQARKQEAMMRKHAQMAGQPYGQPYPPGAGTARPGVPAGPQGPGQAPQADPLKPVQMPPAQEGSPMQEGSPISDQIPEADVPAPEADDSAVSPSEDTPGKE